MKAGLPRLRIVLAVFGCLQIIWFGWCLSGATPAEWGDTYQYRHAADELSAFHLSVIWSYLRPPGYPLLLVAARLLGMKATVLAAVFNRATALAALWLLPELAGVGLAAGFLLLTAFSSILSYENLLMSEAPLPGFLMLAWILGLRAQMLWQRRRFAAAAGLLALQALWLTSLKPAFKGYPVLELAILALLTALGRPRLARRERFAAAGAAVAVLAIMGLANGVLFNASGEEPMRWNKSVALTQVLPRLSDEERAALPRRARASYAAYQKLWRDHGPDYNGIPVTSEEGAELFDALKWRHGGEFLWLDLRKMANLIRYSSWNENFGKVDLRLGIPRGFGSGGILLATCALGAALAFATRRRKDARPELGTLLETGGGAAYGFAVQLFVAMNDVARISLMWLIPAFVFLVQLWWLAWRSAGLKPKRSGL